jgi:septum formation protein
MAAIAEPHVDLVLASRSPARRRMLEAAGLTFRVERPDVDESAIRSTLADFDHYGGAERVARVLARAKGEDVSRRLPGALVIGADQVLALDREIFSKPADMAAARQTLRVLSGRTHRLLSAASLAIDGAQVWSHLDIASLTMRKLSDAFIDDYLARAGDKVCTSVGGYELEGLGVQLFERVDGDYFTILGLPLLPLLAELRARGVVAS